MARLSCGRGERQERLLCAALAGGVRRHRVWSKVRARSDNRKHLLNAVTQGEFELSPVAKATADNLQKAVTTDTSLDTQVIVSGTHVQLSQEIWI